MNKPAESLDIPDPRIVEAVATLDGRAWIASDAQGRPVRLDEADAEDVAIINLAMNWREEPER
jgi:hypothetical protein